MDRRRSITSSSFKILFKDGQPGRCRLGNGKAVARELPPAFDTPCLRRRWEGWMTLPVLDPQQTNPQETEMAAVLREYRTESGRSLLALLDESPLLLIFLRHFGCSF